MPYAIGNRDYFAVSTCALSTLTPKRYSAISSAGAMLKGFVWGNQLFIIDELAAILAADSCRSAGSGGHSLFGLSLGGNCWRFNLPARSG
jgi:hypothetical protein